MTYTQTYDQLYATSLTPEFHEKTCGYWFTVPTGAWLTRRSPHALA